MHPENEDFREFSKFVESVRGSSGKLLERIEMPEDAFRMLKKVRRCVSEGIDFCEKISKKCDFLPPWVRKCISSRTKERFRE